MELKQGIQVEVIWRDADVLELRVSARNEAFAGRVDVYASADQMSEVASKLDGFLQAPSDVREIGLGGFGPQLAGGAVNMRFFCRDSAGHSFVEVQMESVKS